MSDTQGDFTFDGDLKLITVGSGVTSFSAGDLYSRWKDWCKISDNSKYAPAFANSVGGESLGGGESVGGYFFIQNGWQVRPDETDHTLVVSGNLFPIPDTAGIFAPTIGDFTVVVSMRTSSLTQKVTVEASVTASDIADSVWAHDVSTDTSGAGRTLREAKEASEITIGLV